MFCKFVNVICGYNEAIRDKKQYSGVFDIRD